MKIVCYNDNAVAALVTLGECYFDASMSIDPPGYFPTDKFVLCAGEDEWRDLIRQLDNKQINNFTSGITIGMMRYWTDRFSPAALAFGKEVSERLSQEITCVEEKKLSNFMYGLYSYDQEVFEVLSKLPGFSWDDKAIESIDLEVVEELKTALKMRSRIFANSMGLESVALSPEEEQQRKEIIAKYGEVDTLFVLGPGLEESVH